MRSPAVFAAALILLAASVRSAPVDSVNFTEAVFVSGNGLGSMTGIAWAPDGSNRLFVTRKGGEVRIVQNGVLLATPFATETVYTNSECGLIGLCFDPDFLNNSYIYFFLTVSASEQRIVRYTATATVGANRTEIVTGLPTAGNNHDGGAVGIGPDGRLYWAIGDLGNGTGVNNDLTSLAAKIGRVNRLSGAPCNDNPFFGQGNSNTDRIWARGWRNPFTFIFQPGTGQLWVNCVGTNWEQVFLPHRGSHAGYNAYENNQPAGFITPAIAYHTAGATARTITAAGASRANGIVTITTTAAHLFRKGALVNIAGVTDPGFNGAFAVASTPSSTQFTYLQAGTVTTSGSGAATLQTIGSGSGAAITGGCFYDSTAFPAAYRGNYFFGDYVSGRIMRTTLDAQNTPSRVEEFVTGHALHVDMATGPDGALYYANQNSFGTIRRLAYNGTAPEAIVQPTAFDVLEGGSSLFSVRLRSAPVGNVIVTVQRISGDDDLAVSGNGTLTFTPANYQSPQTVTITAAEDTDLSNDSTLFRVSAPGLPSYDIPVNGIDNDEPQLVVSTTSVTAVEGGTANFTVRLASAPASSVTVTAARTAGDSDITVSSGASLTFTTLNFATPQTVTIAAAQDADNTGDTATITVSAIGETPREVAVTVTDDDPLSPTFTSNAVTAAVAGAAYTYDANATGNPLPTFTLSTFPAGMSIDAGTGVISWTPATTGTFAVVIQAANGVLPNVIQSFDIIVSPDNGPAAVITYPTAGAVLSGTTAEFFGDGIDDVGTVKGEFFVDSVLRFTDTAAGNHYHYGGSHQLFDTTPFSNGPHTLQLRVTDTKGQTSTATVQAMIGNGGDAWRAEKFNLPAEAAISAFDVDADGDGLLNVYEYATDSAPKSPGLARLPVAQVVNVGGNDYLTIQFVMATWATDVTFRVEATGDLGATNWPQIDPANPAYRVSTQENVPSPGLTTVTVRDLVPMGTTPRFMRLRVTK